jgi:hypothetical protein
MIYYNMGAQTARAHIINKKWNFVLAYCIQYFKCPLSKFLYVCVYKQKFLWCACTCKHYIHSTTIFILEFRVDLIVGLRVRNKIFII